MSSVDSKEVDNKRLMVIAKHHPQLRDLIMDPKVLAIGPLASASDDDQGMKPMIKPPSPIVISSSGKVLRGNHFGAKGNKKQASPFTMKPSYKIGIRTSLPVPMMSKADTNIWSILKHFVGKELSKITIPIVFNEPLSLIQRITEYMTYASLVEKASVCDDPIERMAYVAGFAVSALSSNLERTGKPFNPLLGETYELDRPDLGFRFVGEQVSHHPPVTAFHAQGLAYSFYGAISPRLRVWGKTIDICPKGLITLELNRYNEAYMWSNVNCCVHNIIMGSLWIEHYGTMEITSTCSDIKAVVNFKQSGWFNKDLHKVEGYIYRGKTKVLAVFGSWVKCLYMMPAQDYDNQLGKFDAKRKSKIRNSVVSESVAMPEMDGQRLLWQVHPKPANSKKFYAYSAFSMCLNEMVPGMDRILPPTDSRFRPDIRSMEDGNFDGSASEKVRVEEKQREKRKERVASAMEVQPTWFRMGVNPHSLKTDWVFDPTYWNREWDRCPDIF